MLLRAVGIALLLLVGGLGAVWPDTPVWPVEISRGGLGLIGPVQFFTQASLFSTAGAAGPSSTIYCFEFSSTGETLARYTLDPKNTGDVIAYATYRREGDLVLRIDYPLKTPVSSRQIPLTGLRTACEAALRSDTGSTRDAWRLDGQGRVVAQTRQYQPSGLVDRWMRLDYDASGRLSRLTQGSTVLTLTYQSNIVTQKTVNGDRTVATSTWTWEGNDPVKVVYDGEADPNRVISYLRDPQGNSLSVLERGSASTPLRVFQASYVYFPAPAGPPPRVITEQEFSALVFDPKVKPFAFQGKRVVLVEFFADWAGPSRQLNKTLADVAATSGANADFYRVNVDAASDLVAALGIQEVPFLLLVNPGQQPRSAKGALSKETLLRILTDAGALPKP